jgi:FkbH-like protein
MDLAALKRNLKKDVSGLPVVSFALLGDTPTQLLSLALKGYGVQEGYNIDLFEAEYNQIDLQILNISSELYDSNARFVIIFQATEKLILEFYKLDKNARDHFAEDHIAKVAQYIETINSKLKANIIYFNFPEISDNTFGNYSNKVISSFTYQLRKINFELMNLAISYKNFFINDVSALQNKFGRSFAFSPSMYTNAGMVYSLDHLPHVAKNTIDIVKSINGQIKKCLVLDLDNTLWGGIIGDDGLEGIQIGNLGIGETFSKWQQWIKQLQERGIILAVCSKNEESIAMEPFQKHPDMVLKLDDIAVFVANWDNKADNIRHIQSVLNIGFDSIVFVDDNPAERKMVRDNLPEVTVPELPEDPAEYLSFLQHLNLFETASYTDGDGDRTRQYQEESKRAGLKKSFVNEEEFLQSLNMTSKCGPFEKLDIPRIAQLTQRSNQFNLRTIRYTDEDINRITSSENHFTLSFKLEDMFGDYGLVSAIIMEKKNEQDLMIDTWIMSCRVLKRGLEQLVLNEIVAIAKANNFKRVIGEYIPTSKNNMVAGHYTGLGFALTTVPNTWTIDVDTYQEKEHFIKKLEPVKN